MESLRLPKDYIKPDYAGGSLANIPATVAALLGAPFSGLPPLREEFWKSVRGRARRVILLLVDSLGWQIYQRERANLAWPAERAQIETRITSVFPSTTVAALSSLWTGFAPAQHGLAGLRLFFPEFGVLGQMIQFTPDFARFPGALIDAGLSPDDFLAVPGFAQQLAAAGVPSFSMKPHNILHSALSTMHDRGITEQYGYLSAADLFVRLQALLERTAGQKLYVNAYWPTIDTLCHYRGPDHPSVGAEVRSTFALLKSELLDKLSPAARQDTLLLITSDHGHVPAPLEQCIYLEDHPELDDLLLMRPAGEPRTPYLYARQGCQQAVLDYLHDHFNEKLVAYASEQVLAAGLLGPPPHAPAIARRLGDVIVTLRPGFTLASRHEKDELRRFQGLHGGLSQAEMEIPWLVFDLANY